MICRIGLGKTYVSSEKANSYPLKILIVCQKSKINDWCEHFKSLYDYDVYDLTKSKFINDFIFRCDKCVAIINYDLIWRRKELLKLKDFTLILDESSLINNEVTKRAKFILKLNPTNTILLSGSLCGGRYERLFSQIRLLGWNISKKMYYAQYVDMEISDDGYPVIKGYKNVDRLKRKMREHGCVFMKSEEVLNLPDQNFITVKVPESKEYRKFKRTGIVTVGDTELVGDTTLTKLLYSRMLCGHYNVDKLKAFQDLVESTDDRLIVFYNFTDELERLKRIAIESERLFSVVNGQTKDLYAYNECENSITFVQYQAGALGLNLQKANKTIYFSPPLSSELFEQSKKRVHRIGQEQPCFYYQLTSGIEYRIYDTLAMRKDYTDKLFEEESE